MKTRLVYCALLTVCHITNALDYKPLTGNVKQYSYSNEQPRSRITYLEDLQGNQYVVKQYRYEQWPSILATSICELVALDMGHAIKVPLNDACMIPAGVAFLGKETAVPASLHRIVPGIPFSEYRLSTEGCYRDLDLKQKDEHGSPLGLSRELIYHMSLHADFPAMVALDTYASNMGRLWHNFFYDEATDMFYGIDMASSFFKDLCAPSIKNITQMLSDSKIYFTPSEGKALVRYYMTLKKLIKRFPASYLCNQIDAYAYQAGYYDTSFFSKEVKDYCLHLLEKRKKTIRKSCANAVQLKIELKLLLQRHGLL